MSRFKYDTRTPMGQIISESINDLQLGIFKISRASEAITLMDSEQIMNEIGVEEGNQAGFKSGLNQLRKALEAEPFSKLLPAYDQG